jgi:hypothetical protein
VTIAPGVPVKVTVALPPEQIVALPEIVTVGGGITVMVTDPVVGCEQLGAPEVATLTSVIVVVEEYVLVNVADPDAFSVIVWFGFDPM